VSIDPSYLFAHPPSTQQLATYLLYVTMLCQNTKIFIYKQSENQLQRVTRLLKQEPHLINFTRRVCVRNVLIVDTMQTNIISHIHC
jgi:hypothetical protein